MPVIEVLVFGKDERGDRLLDQRAPGHAQQGADGEVGLQDHQPRLAEGAIAHRRQVIEVEIARPRGVQFRLRPAQFLVLHLQLDLMHAQFMKRLPRCFGRQGLEVFRRLGVFSPDDLFGLSAQFGGLFGSVMRAGHYAPSAFDRSPDLLGRSVVAIAYICPASFSKAVEIIETSMTVSPLAIRWVRYDSRISAWLS